MSARFEPLAPDPHCDFCSGRRQPVLLDIDAAYCISLIEQPHRTAYAAAHFHKIGLCRQVEFYLTRRFPSGTGLGVWISHRAVAQEALARGQKRVLIMEDDVAFRKDIPAIAPRVARAMRKLPSDWWGLFLGHLAIQSYFKGWGLLRTRSFCAHAYIANTPLLRWLADVRPRDPAVAYWRSFGPTVDAAISNLPHMYALFPQVALQRFFEDMRVHPKFRDDGQRRRWNDLDRVRNYTIFRGSLLFEWLAISGAPFHWLTIDWFRRRTEKRSSDFRAIRATGLFDDEFYLQKYPDVAQAGINPFGHYLEYGFKEGRWPNPSFDPDYYAAQAQDLFPGENPLLHYLHVGMKRGDRTQPEAADAKRVKTA